MEEMIKQDSVSPEDARHRKRRKIASLCSFAGLLAFFAVVTLVVGKPLVDNLSNPENFRIWVDQQGPFAPLTLMGIMCLQVVISVIPGEPIEIGAGYAFGPVWGTLICLAGAAIGSLIILLFTRALGIKMVEAFFPREKILSFKFLRSSRRLNLLIFILFLIPGTPKDIITYLAGLTPMRIWTFLLLSSIARIPSVISSTLGGDALGTQNYTAAAVIFAVTALVSLCGIFLYQRIARTEDRKEAERQKQEALPVQADAAKEPDKTEEAKLPSVLSAEVLFPEEARLSDSCEKALGESETEASKT